MNAANHRKFGSRAAALCSLLWFALLACLPAAQAQQLLDQSNLISVAGGFAAYDINSLSSMAQTFTVGKAGFLTQIDLQLVRLDQTMPTRDLVFTLTAPTNSNFPIGSPALATITLHPTDVPNINGFSTTQAVTSIHLGPSAVPVSPGQVLSLQLTSTEPYTSGRLAYDWVVSQSTGLDVYGPGSAWQNFNNTTYFHSSAQPLDFGFKTYVTVPEPSAATLLMLGSSVIYLLRRRTKRTHPGL